MAQSSRPSIQIDLNEFKLHLHLKSRTKLTLHFDSPSRRFYLSVIALVVHEMKKLGKIKSIPLQEHLDLLVLLNESIGGSAGSSGKENLLHRIYRKWKDALPNLEEAPLFKVLGKKKEEGDGAIGKIYSFTDAEKDEWANLFEYMGSNENVRLKFAIDKIGVGLNETSIIFEDSLDGEAWDQFISSLKDGRKEESELVEESAGPEPPVVPISFPQEQERKISWLIQYRWVLLIGVIGIMAGIIWKVYLTPAPMEVASKEKMAFPLPDQPSIAVLPFANMSEDPKQEFLSDGITGSIITALSRMPALFVIARNSTFTYKGKPVKVKQVSEELGVQYVLEGSLQRSGDRIRINAQLSDALTGRRLWAERYDRDLKDIFDMQDEITMKVVTAVRVKLTVGESGRIYEKGTKNLDAYLKVVQGFELKGSTMNKERVQRAMQLFEEAIALDPGYALAYSYLAVSHFDLVVMGASESPRESLQRALELGKKAVALDDSNALAHAVLIWPYLMLGQKHKAIEEAEKAVSLGPNSAGAYFSLGAALLNDDRPQEAVPVLQKSLRLSPIPVHSQVLGTLATSYRALGQYDEAAATYKKMLQLYGPDHFLAHLDLAITYAMMDREKEARAEGAEVLRIDPKFSIERYMKGLPWDQSRKDRRIELLRKAGLK